ncbi:hypothetical protein SKAU_G00377570, partial [Synaphobranchus kaupii]
GTDGRRDRQTSLPHRTEEEGRHAGRSRALVKYKERRKGGVKKGGDRNTRNLLYLSVPHRPRDPVRHLLSASVEQFSHTISEKVLNCLIKNDVKNEPSARPETGLSKKDGLRIFAARRRNRQC